MSEALDAVMERASRALVEMDYLESEAGCLEGLRLARAERDWVAYTRVLMPLQECRRQRRMIAAEAGVQLGTAGGLSDEESLGHGCIAVTRPLSAEDARRLAERAGAARQHVEVLWCDNAAVSAEDGGPAAWRVVTYDGSGLEAEVPAPRHLPLNVRLQMVGPVGFRHETSDGGSSKAGVGPADPALPQAVTGAGHWFVAASEALGDAALATVTAELGSLERVEQLERMVAAVGDHEKLHQRLNEAVRALVPGLPARTGSGVGVG